MTALSSPRPQQTLGHIDAESMTVALCSPDDKKKKTAVWQCGTVPISWSVAASLQPKTAQKNTIQNRTVPAVNVQYLALSRHGRGGTQNVQIPVIFFLTNSHKGMWKTLTLMCMYNYSDRLFVSLF